MRITFALSFLSVFLGCGTPQDQRAGDSTSTDGPRLDRGSGRPAEPRTQKDVETLVSELGSKDAEVRRRAAKALKRMDGKAVAAMPGLIEALQDSDVAVRRIAADALGDFDDDVRHIVRPPLLKTLKTDADAEVRVEAMWSLVLFELEESDGTTLVAAWKDPSKDVRTTVLWALKHFKFHNKETLSIAVQAIQDEDLYEDALNAVNSLGAKLRPVLPEIRHLTKSNDEQVRAGGIAALGVVGPQETDVATIQAACKHRSGVVRLRAFESLRWCRPFSKTSVDLAITGLSDESYEVCQKAALVLGAAGPVMKGVVPALVNGMKSDDSAVATSCADALGMMGPKAASAVDALIEVTEKRGLFVGSEAAEALGHIGPVNKRVLPALLRAIRNKSTRRQAIEGIKHWGAAAAPTVPLLIEVIREGPKENLLSYEPAIEALGRIGPSAKAAVKVLILAAKEESDKRDEIVEALGRIGPAAREAVPMLTKYVASDGEPYLSAKSALALAAIGGDAKDAAPALEKIFQDRTNYQSYDNDRWSAAAVALGRMGFVDKVVPVLVETLDDKDKRRWERAHAIIALGQIGAAAASAKPRLQKFSEDTDSFYEWIAATALARMGETDRVVPALMEHLKSGDTQRGDHALNCLYDLGPLAKPALLALETLRDHSNAPKKLIERIDTVIYAILGKKYFFRL